VHKGALAGATASETTGIHAFVAGLFASAAHARGVRVHRVARPSGKRSYACFAHPLPPGSGVQGVRSAPAVIIFIRDPASACAFEPEALERLYDLTTSEAILARSLAQGLTLEDAAANRGISDETARTQLKSLFEKTGCHRQAELVALLVGGNRI